MEDGHRVLGGVIVCLIALLIMWKLIYIYAVIMALYALSWLIFSANKKINKNKRNVVKPQPTVRFVESHYQPKKVTNISRV